MNISSTVQGVAATVESQFALAGKSWGPAQAVIGAWGVYNVGREVFNNYLAEWTSEQDSDLQALAQGFDFNQDWVPDSHHDRFAEFRIWKDANSNGVAANHKCFNLVA